MKFQQFLEASQKAKGKIGEGATPSFKELVEDELKKLSSLENTNIDPDFEITEDEFNSIMEEVYKTPRFKEAPHLYEDDLNEAATFDLKTFLIQTANYMKAEAGIEDAVKKLYDAKIAGVKKETEFEDRIEFGLYAKKRFEADERITYFQGQIQKDKKCSNKDQFIEDYNIQLANNQYFCIYKYSTVEYNAQYSNTCLGIKDQNAKISCSISSPSVSSSSC